MNCSNCPECCHCCKYSFDSVYEEDSPCFNCKDHYNFTFNNDFIKFCPQTGDKVN